MIRTERERIRDARKLNIIKAFAGNETLFTNEIAKKVGVVWPVASRLLQDLVDEKRLSGNKVDGYTLFKEERKKSLLEKIKGILHI